jgi:hypothetical protein
VEKSKFQNPKSKIPLLHYSIIPIYELIVPEEIAYAGYYSGNVN